MVAAGGEFSRRVSTRDIMAQLHVTRVKREFREIVTSEEVNRVGPFVRWAYIYPVVALVLWVRFCENWCLASVRSTYVLHFFHL